MIVSPGSAFVVQPDDGNVLRQLAGQIQEFRWRHGLDSVHRQDVTVLLPSWSTSLFVVDHMSMNDTMDSRRSPTESLMALLSTGANVIWYEDRCQDPPSLNGPFPQIQGWIWKTGTYVELRP